MVMRYYFAYGSNLDVAQMKVRCRRPVTAGKARIDGYRLGFTGFSSGRWKCGVADIVPDDTSEVWGLLYKLTEHDLFHIDLYEGHPVFYHRINVKVRDENASIIDAVSYEIVNKKEFVIPSAEYLDIIKSAVEKFGFPAEYRSYVNNFVFMT